jgi:hypothetical protein
MGILFRPIAIIIEVIILMAVICSLLTGLKFTLFDFGINKKYFRFIHLAIMILCGLALVFVASHLITFYPRISILSEY